MQTEFRLPALGADMDAGTVVEWRVAPGDRCRRGDVVAVVETDKGAIDVEIFIDGVVRELLVPPGTRVPVGTVLAVPRDRGAGSRVGTHTGAAADSRGRSVARTLSSASGSRHGAACADLARSSQARAGTARRCRVAARHGAGGRDHGGRMSSVPEPHPSPLPLSLARGAAGMRAAIAAAMSRSKREIPHYYLATTVDVTRRRDWLAAHNAAVPVTERLLLRGVAGEGRRAGLPRPRRASAASIATDHYEPGPVVHVGVAVALRGGGLVAPAIMDTASRPLAALMDGFRDLVARAVPGDCVPVNSPHPPSS